MACLTVALALFVIHVHAFGTWSPETNLPSAIQEVSVAALNGQVYVVGGSLNQVRSNENRRFDPSTRLWTSGAPYPGTARDHMGLVAVGSSLYLIGGVTAWPQPSVTTVQRYDPGTNSWTALAPLPAARGAVGVATLNGKIYAAGGIRAGVSVNDFAAYDPGTNTWTALPVMPTARDHLTAAAIGGKIYALGGRNAGTCSPLRTVEVYDPASNTWTTGVPMINARAGHATGAANNHIQVFGGEGNPANCGAISTAEDFDPITNAWTALPNMPTPRHGTGGATIGASIYIPGGATASGDAATSVHERFDATAPAPPVPAPWTSQDIGAVGAPGSATYSNGTFTVQGAGADIWGTADAFQFVSQPLSGDGQITARVVGLQNTNTFAKAGVMIRQALTAGSPHVVLDVKAGGGLELMTRPAAGGQTTFVAGGSSGSPTWVRLTRSGTTIVGSSSTDGQAWTPIGNVTANLGASVYVGLAVSSHVTGVLTTATFDNVAASTGGPAGIPPTVSLTSPSNGATYTAPASIPLSATAADSDGSVSRVDFYANQALVGSSTVSPYTFNWTNVPSGSYAITAVATDNTGLQATSSAANVTVSGTTPGPLPAPWQQQDVGTTGAAGSATVSSGTFSVTGAGADIWGTADGFHYVYQPLSGDGQITARVTGVQNTNSFAKAGVMIRETLTAGSMHALLDLKAGGGLEFMARTATGGATTFVAGAASAAPIWLRLSRSGSTISASVSNDGTAWSPVGSATVAMASTVTVGLAVCSHVAGTTTTGTFDNVALGAVSPPPPPPVSFTPKALAVAGTASGTAVGVANFNGPTSLAIGPDGKLYVSVVNGRLFVMTIDQAKLAQAGQVAVTQVQEFDDIYLKPSLTCNINNDPNNCQQLSSTGSGRQVTGIALDPSSTPSRIVLYVSNSGLGKNTTDITLDTYSGTITRLILEPDPNTPGLQSVTGNQDLVTGLPRSREAHSINGMSIGSDGWLYLSAGGHTNAGQPSTFFADLAEYFLSASVVRLNLAALVGRTLPIDVRNVKQRADLVPFSGTFELYATGYRNGYDLVWHSNGRLYLNGNAANQNQGNTPGAADGCSTPSISPGDQPDTLNLVTAGAYGGHPNPARGECVWGDGTIYTPALAPLPNFVQPIVKYVNGGSSDGIAEYKSDAFNGALRGNLISATYAGDQTLRRVVLSADGGSVQQVQSLGTFVQPLDVWVDVGGDIFVAEYGANRVTVLIPTVLPSCPVPNSDPKTTDSDADGYTDFDEQANGTDPCSAASKPADADGDHVSDLLDADDDNDGIADTQDQLQLDPQNGAGTGLPLAFEWNPSDPAYGKVGNTGFTGSQISSKAAVDAASGHAIIREGIHAGDAGGHLTMWTYSGTAQGASNDQVNALQVGFDSSSDFRVYSRIVQPFTGVTPAPGHAGGIFFGPNEDNYARLALVGTSGGGKALQFAVESGGVFTVQAALDLGGVTISNLDIFIVGNAAAHTLAAYYDLNTTGTMTALGAAVAVPAAWFSNNAGAAANTSLTGIMVSNGAAPQMAFGYDFFRIDRNVSPPPPPSGPPSAPSNPAPADGATGIPATTSVSWLPSSNATSYDVAFGTANPPATVSTGQAGTTYQPPASLGASTKYFWRVIANGPGGTTTGPVWSFTTAAAPPPPTGNIVLYASDVPASNLHGWTTAADTTSPNGTKLVTADNGASSLNAPLASPSQYFDVTFDAPAGTPYTIWLRLKALNNNKFNDSVWAQFSDARVNGGAAYAIGSASGLLINLATSSNASSLSNWGWQNTAYWLSQAVTVTFATSGTHTLRIQIREDGVQLDQMVLSSTTYLNAAPGPVSNDTTIVPK